MATGYERGMGYNTMRMTERDDKDTLYEAFFCEFSLFPFPFSLFSFSSFLFLLFPFRRIHPCYYFGLDWIWIMERGGVFLNLSRFTHLATCHLVFVSLYINIAFSFFFWRAGCAGGLNTDRMSGGEEG